MTINVSHLKEKNVLEHFFFTRQSGSPSQITGSSRPHSVWQFTVSVGCQRDFGRSSHLLSKLSVYTV